MGDTGKVVRKTLQLLLAGETDPDRSSLANGAAVDECPAAVQQWLASAASTASRVDLAGLFDRYIRSSAGYAIRGVLWDQGESGTGILGLGQHTCMSELIAGWRELWGQGEFPFLFVQKPSGLGNAWSTDDPITREANEFKPLPDIKRVGSGQGRYLYTRLMLDNSNAWMVPACDLGPNVHPSNKWGYGNRAA